MLKSIKVEDLEKLTEETIPKQIHLGDNSVKNQQNILGPAISEFNALNYIKEMASKNEIFKSYIGQGFNPVIVPPVVLRNVLENPGWYTSYTPYQAEISQGRLESLLNFQTLIAELTGLAFSNASLLDEATAAAEAMFMAYNNSQGKKKNFFVSSSVFPHIKDLLYSRAHYLGISILEGDHTDSKFLSSNNFFGGIVQNPDNLGKVQDLTAFAEQMKETGAMSIIAADIMSLLLCKSPGDMGFDIAVGSAQRFGVPMMNGGPHAGFISTKEDFKRKLPGRVVGISKDVHGNQAYRLAMQTREQHIRRDKATSNICTAQALLANMAAFYAIFHGKKGLIDISHRLSLFATILYNQLSSVGYVLVNQQDEMFDTLVVDVGKSGLQYDQVITEFEKNKINLRLLENNLISVTINETTSLADLEELIVLFNSLKGVKSDFKIENIVGNFNADNVSLSKHLRRHTETILNQDIFNKFSSEHQILRYIYYLQSKDISLCNSMITLGSCTMKLNATTEMVRKTIIKMN